MGFHSLLRVIVAVYIAVRVAGHAESTLSACDGALGSSSLCDSNSDDSQVLIQSLSPRSLLPGHRDGADVGKRSGEPLMTLHKGMEQLEEKQLPQQTPHKPPAKMVQEALQSVVVLQPNESLQQASMQLNGTLQADSISPIEPVELKGRAASAGVLWEALHAKGIWAYTPLAAVFGILAVVHAFGFYASANRKDKETLEEMYLRNRSEGFVCNLFVGAITISLLLLVNSTIPLLPLNPILYWLLPAQLLANYIKDVFCHCFRHFLLCTWYGMSEEDFITVVHRRDGWTTEATMLCEKYGVWNVKKMDAINRRVGHMVHYSVHVWFFWLYPNSIAAIQQVTLLSFLKFLGHVATETNDSIGKYIFNGSRIRDGNLGRYNLIVVNCWGGCGKVLLFLLGVFIIPLDSTSVARLVTVVVQPVVFGDTAGELIGSFFGRYEFYVRGFGEVNKKTVEGTLAVWVASFLGVFVALECMASLDEGLGVALVVPNVWCAVIVATVATFMEVASLRGTDNFFMHTAGSAVMLLLSKR